MECCYVSVTSDGCKNINLLALYYQLEFLLLHHIISSFNSVFAIIVLIFHVLPHNQDEKRFTPSPCFYCLDHECFCNNGTSIVLFHSTYCYKLITTNITWL